MRYTSSSASVYWANYIASIFFLRETCYVVGTTWGFTSTGCQAGLRRRVARSRIKGKVINLARHLNRTSEGISIPCAKADGSDRASRPIVSGNWLRGVFLTHKYNTNLYNQIKNCIFHWNGKWKDFEGDVLLIVNETTLYNYSPFTLAPNNCTQLFSCIDDDDFLFQHSVSDVIRLMFAGLWTPERSFPLPHCTRPNNLKDWWHALAWFEKSASMNRLVTLLHSNWPAQEARTIHDEGCPTSTSALNTSKHVRYNQWNI